MSVFVSAAVGIPGLQAGEDVNMGLAFLRLIRLEQEMDEAKTLRAQTAAQCAPSVPAKTGQLWEECERCGQEPVYMPLHLCENCWPKARA